MTMNIFDSHVHLDIKNPNSVIEYINDDRLLGINLILNSDIEKQYFFHLIDEIRNSKKKILLTVTQDYRKDNMDLVRKLNDSGFEKYALKLHPRIEKYSHNDIIGIIKYIKENDFIYIIVDAFDYGHELQYQISKELVIELALAFPNKKVIVAHSGGYKVLEYSLTMKNLVNVFYDISYMNYFRLSSVINDFKQFIAYNSNRILFGTDFPSFRLNDTIELLENITNDLPDKDIIRDRILLQNYSSNFIEL